ncbi:phage tail protein [Thauera butanivorans]|uniref:phage tail protein n=1 Tax=Thauera butanivorans TaxID=86174 RepID=UPI0008388B17|nr:phage tail protein [Thauera butanivorans]
MLMSFGMFVFELASLPFQSMEQAMGWRHAASSRVGVRPARQFLGPDDETVTLSGVLAPEITGGEPSITELREMADAGTAAPLIDGNGRVYGHFVITSLNLTRTLFFKDGSARRIEFRIGFARVDEHAGMLSSEP